MNTVGYARYSTEHQDKGVSIEAQDRDMRELSSRQGWTYTETYADRGVSGAKTAEERPELSRLLVDAKLGRFQRVLAFDVSRLARNQHVFWDTIDKFRGCGLTFVTTVMPEIDSTMPEFELLAGVFQGTASYERALTVKKTKVALREIKEQGRWIGRPKAGCRVNEQGKLELNDMGIRVFEMLLAFPNLKATEVQAEFGLKDYDTAYHLLKSIKNFHGAP